MIAAGSRGDMGESCQRMGRPQVTEGMLAQGHLAARQAGLRWNAPAWSPREGDGFVEPGRTSSLPDPATRVVPRAGLRRWVDADRELSRAWVHRRRGARARPAVGALPEARSRRERAV